MADDVQYYDELPGPLGNLPRKGFPVSDLALISTVQPLLQGVTGCLEALAEAKAHDYQAPEQECATLEFLVHQLEMAQQILTRWNASRPQPARGRPSPPTKEDQDAE